MIDFVSLGDLYSEQDELSWGQYLPKEEDIIELIIDSSSHKAMSFYFTGEDVLIMIGWMAYGRDEFLNPQELDLARRLTEWIEGISDDSS